MAFHKDTGTIYTGGSDGRVLSWSKPTPTSSYVSTPAEGGANVLINNAVHGGSVSTLEVTDGGVVSAGWDDVARITEVVTMQTTGCVSLGGQPKASGSYGNTVIVATKDSLQCIEGGEVKFTKEVHYETRAIAVHGDVVVTGDDKNNIHVYQLEEGGMVEKKVVTGHNGQVHSLAFNKEGTMLAAGDVKEVRIWDAANEFEQVVKGKWQFHTSRITGLAWSDCGSYVASVGTDENLFIWCLAKKMRRLNYKFAHKGGCNGVVWTEEGKVVTTGEDGCLAEWYVGEEVREKFK